uniref:Uncharacterized protein n=1 Tax=Oryza barthii TaxID=65489 RepID=A0A0D3H9Q7_9ORYZ
MESSHRDAGLSHRGRSGSRLLLVLLSSCSETAVSFLPAPALPTSMESTFPSPRPPSTPSSSTPPSSPVPPPSARSPTVPAPADADDDDQGGGSGQEAGGGNGEDEAGGGDDSNGHGDEQDGDYSSDVQRRDVPRHESADGSEIHDEHHVDITGEEPPVSPVPREPPVAPVRNRRPISLLCAVPMIVLYGAYHFTIGGSAFGIDKHVTHDRLMAGGILAGIWLFLLPFLILGHVYFSHRIRVRVLRNNAPSAGEAQVPATEVQVQDEGYFPRKVKASVSLMVLSGLGKIAYLTLGTVWPWAWLSHLIGFIIEIIMLIVKWYMQDVVDFSLLLPEVAEPGKWQLIY